MPPNQVGQVGRNLGSITHGEPSAYLRDLKLLPHTTTDVLERSVALVQKQQLRVIEFVPSRRLLISLGSRST